MLAQLQQRTDVEAAGVDHCGELLRIQLRPGGSVEAVRDALEMMGFAAETAIGIDPDAVRWFGPSKVSELSREEADVIASRVVPAFGATHAMSAEEIALATTRAADALYDCFEDRAHGAAAAPAVPAVPTVLGLASSCATAVADATRSLLGPEGATALGQAIEADMTGAARP